MLKNYFKTTIRSIRKQRFFSFINILGLAVGLTAAIFIFQYAGFQKSFDQHFKDQERIYRVMNERFEGDKMIQRGQITYSAVGPQMADDFPEVELHTTLNFFLNLAFSYDKKPFVEQRVPFAEKSFFDMFDYKILAGVKEEMLDEPMETVITKSLAERVIGERFSANEYLGETIFFHEDAFKVVGIIEDVKESSSLQFDVLLSRSTLFRWWGDHARYSWTGSDYFHYVKLAQGLEEKDLDAKLEEFSKTHFRGDEVTGTFEKFHLQPLGKIHLDQSYEYENHVTADGNMVNILMLIGVFILIMAWVNYINLTTSKALQRAKEVGMRKVVGASLVQLRTQFLLEAFVINLMSLALAITLVQVLQQSFNLLTATSNSFIESMGIEFVGLPVAYWFFGIFFLGTVLSAIYPAFVLSKFKPAQTLKGSFSQSSSGQYLRKGLVVFQFVLSTALISFTLVIANQTDFMRNYDLGYDVDRVMTLNGPINTNLDTTFVTHIHSFVSALEQNASIDIVGVSAGTFGQRLPRTFNVRRNGSDNGVMLNRLGANYNFFDVYGIELVGGRTFEMADHNKDGRKVNKVMLNTKATQLLGYDTPQEAVNSTIRYFGREWIVVGVTKDFHFRSVKQTIEPMLFVPFYEVHGDVYHIKYNAENTQQVVSFVSKTYEEFFPGDLLNYGFMDDRVQSQYEQDELFGRVFNAFTFIGVLIACLGLVGLVGFSAARRTKEIGVRKVLGASIFDILRLISTEFLMLIAGASLLAAPIIYLTACSWLAAFEYRIGLSLPVFILPVLLLLIVSLIIILLQTRKTAITNPVHALHQD